MEKNLNDYLEKIEKYLKPLPISERGDIVKEIKSEILELQSDGKTAEQITGRLGNPKELAKAYVGERGNYLCLAQKHTGNISCIRSTAFARPLYALRHSTHGVTGADGSKKKYPLNTSQKKSFTL